MKKRYALLAATIVGLVACGGSSNPTKVAASLLKPGDLSGEWSLNIGQGDFRLPESGEITDAERKYLPTMDVCDAASQESIDVTKKLTWEAFRQLDLKVDDPIDVPRDRQGQMVFLQEFLMSGDPKELSGMLQDLSVGIEQCQGDIPAGEEGPGSMSKIDIAPVGDESVAARYTIEEAGGGGTWNIHVAFVRTGSILASLSVVDIVLGDSAPVIDQAAFEKILSTAVTKAS